MRWVMPSICVTVDGSISTVEPGANRGLPAPRTTGTRCRRSSSTCTGGEVLLHHVGPHHVDPPFARGLLGQRHGPSGVADERVARAAPTNGSRRSWVST